LELLEERDCTDELCEVDDAAAEDELPLLEGLDGKLGADVISDVREVARLVSVVVGGGSEGRLVLVLLKDEVVLVLELARFVLMHCTLSLLPDVSV
jgi:hypothetical protein